VFCDTLAAYVKFCKASAKKAPAKKAACKKVCKKK
jgi:adenylate kinase